MESRQKQRPAVVVVYKSMAAAVRDIAAQLGVAFEEESVQGHANAVRFRFGPMDGATSTKLALAIPPEALVKRAVLD